MQKFLDAFTQEYPDIVIRQEYQGWDVVFDNLVSAVRAGNPPDFMLSLPAMTMTFQHRGDIIPVDDIVAELDQKYKFIRSQLVPFSYPGATWGVPMWGMTFLWHYRKDALEDAGVTVPTTGVSGSTHVSA